MLAWLMAPQSTPCLVIFILMITCLVAMVRDWVIDYGTEHDDLI